MAKKQRLSTAQKTVIARGKVEGKPGKQIAAEAGVSQSTVDHARQDPEIRSLIERYTEKYAKRVERLFEVTVDELEHDLKDRKASQADRRSSREQALELITLADRAAGRIGGAAASQGRSGEGGEYTMTELFATFRQVTGSK